MTICLSLYLATDRVLTWHQHSLHGVERLHQIADEENQAAGNNVQCETSAFLSRCKAKRSQALASFSWIFVHDSSGSSIATIGGHGVDEVIMPAPPDRNSLRATKKLARPRGYGDEEGSSKR
ncbi:hypothetical protein GOP47_0001377 [Adiantum capillus-veneris]|uniref:Uncharacterized protein n=1 Tax=Adiantum capillus-veneris TaxID=13818 RepID=A0A9D4V8T8_ADICA|nr:hypothetical protein GOP47_0001377 [Adiantum capillus-veneris]